MSIAYDTIAPRYARHRDGHAFVIAILNRLLAKFPGGSVLEVGSGTGVYATGRADAGARTVYAMDLSRQMLRQAPVRDPVVYLQGRATNLPFAGHGIRSSHRPLARHLGCSPSCGQSDPERHQPHVNTIDRSGGCRQDNIFPVDIL